MARDDKAAGAHNTSRYLPLLLIVGLMGIGFFVVEVTNLRDDSVVTSTARASFRHPATPSETFTPRKVHYVTLADIPHQEICLTASSIFTLSKGELEVLAWNHSSKFFDGTEPKKVEVPPREGRDWFRAGQAKKIDWIAHYVANHPSLHEDDIIMYTDAWDVTIQTDMSSVGNVLTRLTGGRRGILFNSEPSCGDSFGLPGPYGEYLRSTKFDVQLAPSDPIQSVPGPHICRQMLIKSSMHSAMGGPNWSLGSGGIVADVKTFREMMAKVVEITNEQVARAMADPRVPLFEGDQISFQLAHPHINVLVDTRSDVFMVSSFLTTKGAVEHYDNVNGCDREYFKGGVPSKLLWYETPHTPMILHFPGGYKKLWGTCADPMAEFFKPQNPGKYMLDVDRNVRVPIHAVCNYYT